MEYTAACGVWSACLTNACGWWNVCYVFWLYAGRGGGVSGYPRAWCRSVSLVRVRPSACSYKSVVRKGLFLVHRITCGKRESVS